MTQKIRLTESELYNMIAEQVNEALQDEGMMDFFRGAGKKIGNDISNGAKTAWNKGKQAAQNASTNVKNYVNSVNQAAQNASTNVKNYVNSVNQAAQNAATNVKNYVNSVNQAGQMSSMNADNQKIADQLETWYKNGVFGNSRQVSSWISGLVNCLNRNFYGRFGQDGSTQRRR